MLKVIDLSVKLGKKEIIHPLSFSFEKGKIIALLGKNGSGKTTLLRALASDLLVHSGQIILDGVDKKDMKDSQYEKMVAILPQSLPKPAISLQELLAFGRYPYHHNNVLSSSEQQMIHQISEELSLADKKDQLVCHLSAGQRQLAYFGLLLSKDSEINLLDEPSSNLDIEVRKLMYEKLKQLKEKGKSILISLHDLNEALDLADEVILMEQGRIIFHGSTQQFIDSDYPQSVFHCEKKLLKDEAGKEYILFK